MLEAILTNHMLSVIAITSIAGIGIMAYDWWQWFVGRGA